MCEPLNERLRGKYILCSCEGIAEEAIMDLLIDGGFLCFQREDLINGERTRIRTSEHLACQYLGTAMEREIAILRILDREKEKFVLPKVYRMRGDISVFNIVTKPEIEILHIIAEGLYADFKAQGGDIKASAYCKQIFGHGRRRQAVKSRDFILQRYENCPECLVDAINKYKQFAKQDEYCLADLLR